MEDLPKILVGQYDSPVTRRVAIALHHYGIPFTRDTRSIFGDAAAIGGISPLTRIPALVLDDVEVLIDSASILDHLDEQAGDAALIPRSGTQRRRVLQMTALAQGTLEKVAAVVYERHFHPPRTLQRRLAGSLPWPGTRWSRRTDQTPCHTVCLRGGTHPCRCDDHHADLVHAGPDG